MASLFETDKDLVRMLKPYKDAPFLKMFKTAMEYYTLGIWSKAKTHLENVEKIKGLPDYPSRSLLKFMQESNFKAPADWPGFRILTEK